MRISKKCQYALSAVFELALRDTDQPVKIHDIAGAQNIPPRFLEVILNQLRHAGFVDSRRGSEGGYMLARAAEDLTVGEVIEYLQGPISMPADDTQKTNKILYFYVINAFELVWENVNRAIAHICNNPTFAELI